MSPEAVKEKLTVTMAPPPAAIAAEKQKAAKKRTEAENLIEGHAATIKGGGKLTADQEARLLRKQGRTGAGVGFVLLGLAAFLILQRYGGLIERPAALHEGSFVHRIWFHEGVTAKPSLNEAYESLKSFPFFFDLTTKLVQFRIFVSLSGFFFVALVAFPGLFGKYWMKLGHLLGSIMTPVLFAVMFYGVFTPVSIVMKIFGRDALRLGKHEGSYWVMREKQRSHDHFEHLS
jgi:hypothetical protein